MTDAFDAGGILTLAAVFALSFGEREAAVLFALLAGLAALVDVYHRWDWASGGGEPE